MSKQGYIDDGILFGLDIPPPVNTLLQEAVIATRSDKKKAEQLFTRAYQIDPHCLQTYFALYKFFFHQARLMEAEYFVLAGLEEAARQGDFPVDYHQLYQEKSEWDLYANETTFFYLYTLNALAFIKLRQSHVTLAETILAILKELDPEDRSGASVIIQLAEVVREESLA